MSNESKNYDVIIIGGGPAGVSAALYAARGGRRVLIIHNNASALHRTERIQNYFGTGETSGVALYETGIAQARSVGADVVLGQVTFVRCDPVGADGADNSFTVVTPECEYSCRRLVIATGTSVKRVDIEGIAEYEGKGVSYCAVCDGFFYRKRVVAVLGAGEFARHEYSALKNLAAKTYLLTNGQPPEFDAENTVTQKIARIAGNGNRVSAVQFEDGSAVDVDGVFVALGVAGAGALARSLGVLTDKSGAIITDDRGMTNVFGLYAAGDCTAGIKQVAKAVFDGMKAGVDIIKN